MKIRPELYFFTQGNKLMRPAVDFTLTAEECHQFYNFIKSINFPTSFASNLTKNITENDNKISDMKSHDCHVIIQHLLSLGHNNY